MLALIRKIVRSRRMIKAPAPLPQVLQSIAAVCASAGKHHMSIVACVAGAARALEDAERGQHGVHNRGWPHLCHGTPTRHDTVRSWQLQHDHAQRLLATGALAAGEAGSCSMTTHSDCLQQDLWQPGTVLVLAPFSGYRCQAAHLVIMRVASRGAL
jgi:hypothetical protein